MKNTEKRKISFVVACYYSEKSLATVVDEIYTTINNTDLDYEIILVNDGSIDGTFNVIEELCSTNHRIKGINLSRNFGQPNAMLAGFSNCTGDLVAYCDDDGQSPVSEIVKFINKIDEGYDMVWAKYPEENRGFLNSIGANLNNRMLKYLFKKPLDLGFGNLWVAKKYVIDETLKFKNQRIYLGGVFLTITTNMTNIICDKRERLSGSSNYSLSKLIVLWLNGLTAFSIAPLRIASLTGGVIALIGMIYMIYLIYSRLTNPELLFGYSSMMSVILFIGGMLMLMIGIVGEYIGRIYINSNSLPQFVVKQKINVNDEQ